MWTVDPDQCCALRKVAPLKDKLANLRAWITAIRRDQTAARASARKVEWDHKFQLVKINPIADWTTKDVWHYLHEHDVPYNPLHDANYTSIGCTHCTRAVRPGEDPRAGRWAGFQKTECGLHIAGKPVAWTNSYWSNSVLGAAPRNAARNAGIDATLNKKTAPTPRALRLI